MTNYRRGADFERKIKKEYEEEGYYVIRSAGSKGPVDLIAFHPMGPCQECGAPETLFIQCKLRKPTKAERENALAFRQQFSICMTLIWPDGKEYV